jgi:hypothetical protein
MILVISYVIFTLLMVPRSGNEFVKILICENFGEVPHGLINSTF